jgi:hypothetical protein
MEARAAEWRPDPADDDAAIGFYLELVGVVRGTVARTTAASELNAALRSVLHGSYVTRAPDNALHTSIFVPDPAGSAQATSRGGRSTRRWNMG